MIEDAVIERLNIVLESSRTLTLAEKGGNEVLIITHPNFRFYSTMNPGDDYGKSELNPALRSRFSEICVSGLNSDEDIILIITEMLPNLNNIDEIKSEEIATLMVEYMKWMNQESLTNTMIGIKVSICEVLSWAKFLVNWNCMNTLDVYVAFVHGVQMLILDDLGIGLPLSRIQVLKLKSLGLEKVLSMCPRKYQLLVEKTIIHPNSLANDNNNNNNNNESENSNKTSNEVLINSNTFSIGSFSFPTGKFLQQHFHSIQSNPYIIQAQSTLSNFQRVLRAMKLSRPILLEGPPGVGKISLISNLARLTVHKLVRINLSEHSEISNLIGVIYLLQIQFWVMKMLEQNLNGVMEYF